MKIENTLENKAKFFAQYWGQNILKAKKNPEITWTIGLGGNKVVEQEYLELTPLSQITDEDAVEVTNLFKDVTKFPKKVIILYAKQILNKIHDYNYLINIEKSLELIDYLRSKGYALPYMGLSVEELISYGWVKLKTK